jgi:hypothetical protein
MGTSVIQGDRFEQDAKASNEIGFGWTNAAFLELYAGLPRQQRIDLARQEIGAFRPFSIDLLTRSNRHKYRGPAMVHK